MMLKKRSLFEDSKSVDDLITHYDKKVQELRNLGISKKLLDQLIRFNNEVIIPFSDQYHYYKKEISKSDEKTIIDDILDNLKIINDLISSKKKHEGIL
ncbi:MAG: hypothetical protein H8E98_02685 [Bacteroidetes bacterium]|nr:hypothetical protein [Bacteroidota bacterium]